MNFRPRRGPTRCSIGCSGNCRPVRCAGVWCSTVGTREDPTHDATLPWPADRRTVDAGLLTLNSVDTEAKGNARDINFDPLVLPPGIEPSDDPLLSARSAVYAASYRRRTGEQTL